MIIGSDALGILLPLISMFYFLSLIFSSLVRSSLVLCDLLQRDFAHYEAMLPPSAHRFHFGAGSGAMSRRWLLQGSIVANRCGMGFGRSPLDIVIRCRTYPRPLH